MEREYNATSDSYGAIAKHSESSADYASSSTTSDAYGVLSARHTLRDRSQMPLEFLRSLDTVIIAVKDNENEDLVSEILAELPQAKRVSPGQAGWNKLLTDSKMQPKHSQILQTQDWEL